MEGGDKGAAGDGEIEAIGDVAGDVLRADA